jgi:hypothetical protein
MAESATIQYLVEISSKVGELVGNVKTLITTSNNLVIEVNAVKQTLAEHDGILVRFADKQDVDNLASKVREHTTDIEKVAKRVLTLEEAPALAALKTAQNIKKALWTIAITLATGGFGTGFFLLWQALKGGYKVATGG